MQVVPNPHAPEIDLRNEFRLCVVRSWDADLNVVLQPGNLNCGIAFACQSVSDAVWSSRDSCLQHQLCQEVGLGLTSCQALRLVFRGIPYQQVFYEVSNRIKDTGLNRYGLFRCSGASGLDGEYVFLVGKVFK